MEDQIAEIERRMDEWEVKRKRSQQGAVLWFGMLTVAVIGSLMLMLTHQGQAVSAHHPASYAQHTSPTGH